MEYNQYTDKIYLHSSSYFVEEKPPENLIGGGYSNDPISNGFQYGFIQSFNNDNNELEKQNIEIDSNKSGQLQEEENKSEDVKKFVCDLCRRTFANQEKYIVHMRCHTGAKPFQCKICLKFYNHTSNLINHMKTHSVERREFKCSICSKKLDNEESFKNHLRIHSNEKPFKCSFCEKAFNHKSNCSTHEKKHINPSVDYPCPICHKSFKHGSNLNGHMKLHKEKQFRCLICFKEFHYKNSYEYHVNKHHKSDCKNSLTKPNKINTEDEKKQLHYCEKCDKKFNYKNNLKAHMASHKKNGNNLLYLACNFCSAIFLEEESLVEHEDEHLKNGSTCFHENMRKEKEEAAENEQEIEKISENLCMVCLKEFENVNELKNHHKIHLCDSPENCYKCKVTLEDNFIWSKPVPDNLKESTHECCWICKNTFENFENFQIHFETHFDKNPFESEKGSKRVSSSHSKKSHSEEPSFSCDKCAKIFRYKGSLKYHQKIHSNIKGYQCHKCTKQFNFLCNLETHINRLHAREED